MEPKYIAGGGVTPVRLLCVAVAILVLAAVPIETFQITASALPTRLERYLTDTVKVAPDECTRLAAGEPITKLLDADEYKGSSAARGVTVTVSGHRPAANGSRASESVLTRMMASPPGAQVSARSGSQTRAGPATRR